jgi:hypothetical protein
VIPVRSWFLTRVLSTFAHEASGATGTRHSPLPLGERHALWAKNSCTNSGAKRGEMAKVYVE